MRVREQTQCTIVFRARIFHSRLRWCYQRAFRALIITYLLSPVGCTISSLYSVFLYCLTYFNMRDIFRTNLNHDDGLLDPPPSSNSQSPGNRSSFEHLYGASIKWYKILLRSLCPLLYLSPFTFVLTQLESISNFLIFFSNFTKYSRICTSQHPTSLLLLYCYSLDIQQVCRLVLIYSIWYDINWFLNSFV